MKTLIGITTCAKNLERRAAIRETWLPLVPRDVDVRFVTGVQAPDDALCLNCPDSYAGLPQKIYRLVEHASAYDLLIKVDDDTFFMPLPEYIAEFAKHDCLAHVRLKGPYPQGGCYSLSRTAMKAVRAHRELFASGLEDVAVGRALAADGVSLTHTDRIKTTHMHGVPLPGNNLISAHCCSPSTMRDVMRAWRECPFPRNRGEISARL